MFNNIFKKFHKQNSEQHAAAPQTANVGRGVHPMGQHLQRKFARGIQYNMKIIIRGDRNVGKSCLFYRLQGNKFREEYVPSDEIQVASIQWNYNATDDIVKVEIWDVVDKGKKRDNLASSMANPKELLKMHNGPPVANGTNESTSQESASDTSSPALDAEFVDVYKGTNGVIFLFDMTKLWTYEYVMREIRRCPKHIPVLILANHRDMGHHRVVTADQVHGFIEGLLEEDLESGRQRCGQIRYAEASMRNGFGLRYLYKFFNLPYLHLQRETLLKQLERNLKEISATCQELDVMVEGDEYNYDKFLEMITQRRRMMADQQSAVPKTSEVPTGPPRSVSMPANMANCNQLNQNGRPTNATDGSTPTPIVKPTPSIIIGANNPLPARYQQQINNNKSANQHKFNHKSTSLEQKGSTSFKNIDDFIPDDIEQNMFRKFLDEPNLHQEDLPLPINEEDSDEEESMHNNPMVAKYQEEIDPEDLIIEETSCDLSQNISTRISLANKIEPNEEKSEVLQITQEDVNEQTYESVDSANKPSDNVNQTTQDVDGETTEEPVSSLPTVTLNCDELDALENLYISKSDSNSLTKEEDKLNIGVSSEASSECGSITTRKPTKSANGVSTSKKTKKAKNENVTINGDDGNVIRKTKKSTKLKTKTGKTKSAKAKTEEEVADEERRQLEEFLGGTDLNTHSPGQEAYETL